MASSKYLLLFYTLISATFFTETAQAQPGIVDSLSRNFHIKNSYYYLKPMAGLVQNRPRITGSDPFIQPTIDYLRRPTIGLLIGYHFGKFDIETGLTTLSVSSGYGFKFLPNPYMTSIGSNLRIGYTHIPLSARYLVWQSKKRVSVHAVAGLGFSWEASGISLNRGIQVSEAYFIDHNGVKYTTRTTQEAIYRNSFWFSTIGLSADYTLSKSFSVHLQLTKFLGTTNTVRVNTTIEPYDELTAYSARTAGGANGTGLTVGLSYHFSKRRQYKLIK